jgi:hypothetical protein
MSDNYNDRLFKSGIRRWLHMARFRWLSKMCEKYEPDLSCVVELGCFDCRSLDFLPEPKLYYGFDANWEGGLESAKQRYSNSKNIILSECIKPDDFYSGDKFSTFISLETLEHIPVDMLDDFIVKISSKISDGGFLFITVPNEIGFIFLMKYLYKNFISADSDVYKPSEVFWAVFGRTSKIARKEHKGFNYNELLILLRKNFKLIECKGLQLEALPLSLNASIGFVMQKSFP